ncbi:TonB-dependent receptor [Steroidobacter agaridevorans]|uniref:TonB-dependent receptor n=1 Tax=Steroidobacter agaridevorans TaxID=2695856 RepID=A0A829YFM0_9GAMM|nr:TonB-dependent receptor [Steroidobacter agaridevorans]GFE82205.1 TonB-dependent receptor [Steroidobacter agaridevorans]GFE85407.1 TonB-dependent receptor [Steroidobacter agaridevorans]
MMRNNRLAIAIAAALASVAPLHGANAQQAAAGASTPGQTELEEVVVTGMRASLETSMDMKRDAIGVVDAISAEDIGKFPDSNLSESLQRITGISIDRRNGEGALVTARGFGAQYNMVTLNGRTMPAADAFAGGNSGDGGVAGQSRAFNFANLASESISAIEVYKTGRADQATGGIGATLNVRTARPFDSDEPVMNVGVKAVTDTTNRVGDDITPEVSGIFSFANDDKTWGVGLSASYQKRDSGSSSSTVNDWNIRNWTPGAQTTNFAPNAVILNAPAEGALYAIPNDIRYHFSDRERERTNAQLTVQFAPTDTLTLTADYTYAETDLTEDRGDQTLWMNANRYSLVDFDTGHAVATPLLLQEDEGTAKDFGFEQQHREQRNELKSIGFNAEWHVTDNFSLALDVHDSTAESLPDDPMTGGGETLFSFAARVPSTCDAAVTNLCTNRFVQTFRFNDGLPIAQRTLYRDPTTTAPTNGVGGDPNYAFTNADLGSQYLRINYQEQVSDITQARIDGNLKFENDSRVQFGVETRAMESRQRASNAQMTLGDWGVARPGELPANLLQPFSLVGQFEDFSTTGAPLAGWKGNANALAQWAVDTYRNWRDPTNTTGVLGYNPAFEQDHTVSEDTVSAYVQYGMNFDLFSRNANLLLGVRYEKTDLEAVSNQIVPLGLIWQDNNDFSEQQGTGMSQVKQENDYDYVLPNLDFDIEVVDNVKARFSYSKTIARAQYNQLRAAVDVGGSQGSSLNGFNPTANAANPLLEPLESDNIDLSVEWYFGDASYLSAGFFHKKVANFIGNEVVTEGLFGITDQTSGPRAQAAVAALQAGGYSTDDTNLFVMMAMMSRPEGFTDDNDVRWEGGAGAFNGSEAQHLAWATEVDLLSDPASDPEYQFDITRPVNNKDAKIHGWELGGQHFFGQTGFGIQANYTIVKGDVSFNDAGAQDLNQFALLGLSDSANLILMYENYGFQVRLAYNWRDEFLQNTNRGNDHNPEYVEEYYQVDLSVGYEVNENLTLSLEGLNLTEEDVRWHGRSINQPWYVEDQGARYALGARYKF